MKRRATRRLPAICLLLASLLFLGACSTPTPTALPTPALTTLAPGHTPAPSTPTDAPAISPTSTSPPPKIVYLGTGAVLETVQRAAQDFGWLAESATDTSPEALRAAAQAGPQVIVVEGLSIQEILPAASEFAEVYFVGLPPSAAGAQAELPANLVLLGGPGTRHDQLGFMAGTTAGLATRNQIVTAISDPASVEGLNYRNGFLHGVRYTCPRCRVQYIDSIGGADVSETAGLYASIGSDVFFAAAGAAGDQALRAAAANSAWVIGSGQALADSFFAESSSPGADRLLTSVYFDPAAAVYAALAQFKAGAPLSGLQPYAASNGAVIVAPFRDNLPVLNKLDQDEIAATLTRLAEGALETGIDPLTGAER